MSYLELVPRLSFSTVGLCWPVNRDAPDAHLAGYPVSPKAGYPARFSTLHLNVEYEPTYEINKDIRCIEGFLFP
jgi:hypothetical protein